MSSTPPLLTLLTDFGNWDTYVGQVKGAILSICPEARLVDLTHDIPAGDIAQAAVAWNDSVPVFPRETIHLAVVDPGVGSHRRAVAAEIGDWRFVCPDNGLLTALLKTWPLRRAVELTNPRFWRADVSAVFHGRDLFGPVAAHWAAGRDITDFGPLIENPLVTWSLPVPVVEDGLVRGEVRSMDRFGTLRTNIPARLLDRHLHWTVEIGDRIISGIHRCFSDVPVGAWLALIGSHGDLELAINQGRAAQYLPAAVGMAVLVRPHGEKS